MKMPVVFSDLVVSCFFSHFGGRAGKNTEQAGKERRQAAVRGGQGKGANDGKRLTPSRYCGTPRERLFHAAGCRQPFPHTAEVCNSDGRGLRTTGGEVFYT